MEETEASGLAPLRPFAQLATERAVGASLDVGGPLESAVGRLEVSGTLFGSRLARAVVARELATTTPSGARQFELINASSPTRTWGAEAMLRLLREPFRVTATYAYTRATEWDATAPAAAAPVAARREVSLIPRHTAGVVASLEQEGVQRIGFECYYTGRQALHDNPYRSESRPYVVVGVLAERVLRTPFGPARFFVNAENLLA
jgi:hypothetical protein